MENVVKTKRLIGNVAPDVHTKMKIEAAKADNQSTIDKYNAMKASL